MAKKRANRLTAQELAERRPTEQTASKLRTCVIKKYVAAKQLQPHHEYAADEIRLVWQALQRGLGIAARSYEPSIGGKGFRDPLERMTSRERGFWREHYVPWSKWAGRTQVGATTMLDVVLSVVADNVGVALCDARLGFKRRGRCMKALRQGLGQYAEFAGMAGR